MITIRYAQEHDHTHDGWLNTWHTISFGDYSDREFMDYSVLCVINEDIIAPQKGGPHHSHHNMEILTYILSGTLEH